ncbi:hypothetical protein L7F22_047305 [Adiantum nelumboides]|nr:hypothetical protein [Adiantum nelumboides]
MQGILFLKDCDDALSANKPEGMSDADWTKINRKAVTYIKMGVTDDILPAIKGLDTAMAVWDKLKASYENTTPVNQVHLMRKQGGKVRELAEKEPDSGVFQMLKQDVTRFLTTILIGTTVANIAATALVTDAATALFGEAGITAATGVMTVVILLLTEITPKSIAVHNATEVARIVVRPVAWLSYILYPVGRIVTAISMGLLKLLGLKSSGEPFVTEEELKLMLRGAELSGAIEEEEQVQFYTIARAMLNKLYIDRLFSI